MRRGLSLGAVAFTAATGMVAVSSPAAVADTTVTFVFSGAPESVEVPPGMTLATIDAFGAAGVTGTGCVPAGLGGHARAAIPVTPGESLQVRVGGAGEFSAEGATAQGGFNGGGDGGAPGFGDFSGSAGGGASDVRQGGTGPDDRVVVAGGGGGAAAGCTGFNEFGGDGGGANGAPGGPSQPIAGGGGGPTGGGSAGSPGDATAGAEGQGGDGASGGGGHSGGGGGGGLFGGGGGGTVQIQGGARGGGGGGSGVCDIGCLAFESGVRSGNGLVTITFSAATPDGPDGAPDAGAAPVAAAPVVGLARFTG